MHAEGRAVVTHPRRLHGLAQLLYGRSAVVPRAKGPGLSAIGHSKGAGQATRPRCYRWNGRLRGWRLPGGDRYGLRSVEHREQPIEVQLLDGGLLPREPDGGVLLKVRVE